MSTLQCTCAWVESDSPQVKANSIAKCPAHKSGAPEARPPQQEAPKCPKCGRTATRYLFNLDGTRAGSDAWWCANELCLQVEIPAAQDTTRNEREEVRVGATYCDECGDSYGSHLSSCSKSRAPIAKEPRPPQDEPMDVVSLVAEGLNAAALRRSAAASEEPQPDIEKLLDKVRTALVFGCNDFQRVNLVAELEAAFSKMQEREKASKQLLAAIYEKDAVHFVDEEITPTAVEQAAADIRAHLRALRERNAELGQDAKDWHRRYTEQVNDKHRILGEYETQANALRERNKELERERNDARESLVRFGEKLDAEISLNASLRTPPASGEWKKAVDDLLDEMTQCANAMADLENLDYTDNLAKVEAARARLDTLHASTLKNAARWEAIEPQLELKHCFFDARSFLRSKLPLLEGEFASVTEFVDALRALRSNTQENT